MLYALDNPQLSFWQRLAAQPYPAKPAVSPSQTGPSSSPSPPYVPLLTGVVYLFATHATNHRSPGKPKPADLVKQSYASPRPCSATTSSSPPTRADLLHAATRIFAYLFGGAAAGGLAVLTNAYCTVPIAESRALPGWASTCGSSTSPSTTRSSTSVILILKGKPVSNLQSYHHAGANLCMWAAYRTRPPAVFIFLLFNSLVHTLNVHYYSMTAMKPPFTGGSRGA